MDMRTKIEQIRRDNPGNLMAATLDLDRYVSLPKAEQTKVKAIIRSGLDNPDSQVGAYAMHSDDYGKYDWVLGPIIQAYHGVKPDFRQQANWLIKGNFDLKTIDPRLEDVSMRVRVARNTALFPLPGSMTRTQRVKFEQRMIEVFEKLIANPEFGGRYVSLTPGSANQIGDEEYQALIMAHKMFKDMSGDPYLQSAGISGDWPYGRGMYESANGQFIVWVNEEDQLRIVSMAKGSDLAVVFRNLDKLLVQIENAGITFATTNKYGNVTSCPSNLGTGMRASIHLPLPRLVTNESRLKAIAKSYGLSVRGLGGEHTAYGTDGMVDISPRARLGVTESQILKMLYQGIKEMLLEDQDLT